MSDMQSIKSLKPTPENASKLLGEYANTEIDRAWSQECIDAMVNLVLRSGDATTIAALASYSFRFDVDAALRRLLQVDQGNSAATQRFCVMLTSERHSGEYPNAPTDLLFKVMEDKFGEGKH